MLPGGLSLQEFDPTIKYLPDDKKHVADALSRNIPVAVLSFLMLNVKILFFFLSFTRGPCRLHGDFRWSASVR